MGRIRLNVDEPAQFQKSLRPEKKKPAKIKHPVLEKKSVTVKALPRYIDSVMAAVAPHILIEALEAIRGVIASSGDRETLKAAETVLKAYGVMDTGGGIVNNITQNNANVGIETPSGHRSLDSLLRESAAGKLTLDVKAETIDCPPSSDPSKLLLSPSA